MKKKRALPLCVCVLLEPADRQEKPAGAFYFRRQRYYDFVLPRAL